MKKIFGHWWVWVSLIICGVLLVVLKMVKSIKKEYEIDDDLLDYVE